MLKGVDPTWFTGLGMIVAAVLSSLVTVWATRGRNTIDTNKATIDGLVDLVNEIQQERDNDKQRLAESERQSARCNRRVSHLQSRMSKLVSYVRKVEAYLRDNKLDKKAPRFDWNDFYKEQNTA